MPLQAVCEHQRLVIIGRRRADGTGLPHMVEDAGNPTTHPFFFHCKFFREHPPRMQNPDGAAAAAAVPRDAAEERALLRQAVIRLEMHSSEVSPILA